MYFFGWIALVVISLWVSLVAFVWGIKSGQFSDQGRARYLPLHNELGTPPAEKPPRPTAEVFALLCIIVIGVSGLVAAVVLTLLHLKG